MSGFVAFCFSPQGLVVTETYIFKTQTDKEGLMQNCVFRLGTSLITLQFILNVPATPLETERD